MNFLGFFTMYMIMLFTYRSFAAGLYLLAPLALSNINRQRLHGSQRHRREHPHLALVTVVLGSGSTMGCNIVSRTIEEIRVRGDWSTRCASGWKPRARR